MKLIPTAGSFVVNDTSRVKMNQTKIVLFSAFIFLFSNNEATCMNKSSLNPFKLPPRKQLFADLMSKYGSKSVRPVLNDNGPIEVRFSFVPTILASFNEKNQHLSIVGDIYMRWIDELLTWDPDDYGGINRISLRAQDLWTPDITVYERIGEGSARANIFEPYIIVNSSGHVNYFDLTYLTVYCRVDMVLFPFDTQLCDIRFSSYCYDSEQLALYFDKSVHSTEYGFKRNGVWKLVHVDVEEVHHLYACCPNPFVEVRFTLELQRIGSFYIYSLGLPSFLLSLTLLSLFLMHPNSAEKVSLSVNNVLAFVLFQQMVVASMPMIGEDTPIVEAYFRLMITVSCFSVLASAFVLRAYHHRPEEPVPCILRFLILRRQTKNKRANNENHQKITEEHRRILAPQPPDLDAAPNHQLSSRNEVNDNEKDIMSQIVPTVYEEFGRRSMVRKGKRNEEEWKLLAMRLDKIFLMSVIFTLIATICYCAVQFKLHAQKYNNHRTELTKVYRIL